MCIYNVLLVVSLIVLVVVLLVVLLLPCSRPRGLLLSGLLRSAAQQGSAPAPPQDHDDICYHVSAESYQ